MNNFSKSNTLHSNLNHTNLNITTNNINIHRTNLNLNKTNVNLNKHLNVKSQSNSFFNPALKLNQKNQN